MHLLMVINEAWRYGCKNSHQYVTVYYVFHYVVGNIKHHARGHTNAHKRTTLQAVCKFSYNTTINNSY